MDHLLLGWLCSVSLIRLEELAQRFLPSMILGLGMTTREICTIFGSQVNPVPCCRLWIKSVQGLKHRVSSHVWSAGHAWCSRQLLLLHFPLDLIAQLLRSLGQACVPLGGEGWQLCQQATCVSRIGGRRDSQILVCSHGSQAVWLIAFPI